MFLVSTHEGSSAAASPGIHVSHRRIEAALSALRQGKPVLVQDDEDRENEADLVVAAEQISVTAMTPLIRDCSGIVCLCITPAHAQALGLRPMVEDNRSQFGTAFTASIEAAGGITTGVSAADRVTTIRAAMQAVRIDPQPASGFDYVDASAAIVSPGHVFPLIARQGGVLERQGHTEASVDLARWAGMAPAGVLCELMNPDGTMAAGGEVDRYAQRYGLVIIHIQELLAYARSQGQR